MIGAMITTASAILKDSEGTFVITEPVTPALEVSTEALFPRL